MCNQNTDREQKAEVSEAIGACVVAIIFGWFAVYGIASMIRDLLIYFI